MPPADSKPLISKLAQALPAGSEFTVHHVSAPPVNCPPLFSAPPNEDPEPTECESHFLSISVDGDDGAAVQAFAVEVLIYTTATLTTIFVSKADSTGYLHVAKLAKGTPSPIKTVISTFLEYLIEQKWRKESRLVLSLFARAQNQYLFPGSIENPSKHVLDDRGLIKWWCKIFDSILQKYPSSSQRPSPAAGGTENNDSPLARGYLVVPGNDAHETRAYFPRPASAEERWKPTDPLRLLGKSLTLPERCLIPRFPDDPKARFALDLDDELPENGPQPMNSPEKNPHPGKWRSVRSIEQFWELMAFRQECAAGRLVGFLWGVFESAELRRRPDETRLEEEGAAAVAQVSLAAGAERPPLLATLPSAADETLLLPTPEATQSSSPSKTQPASTAAAAADIATLPIIPPLTPQSSALLQPPDSPTPLPSNLEPPTDTAEPKDPPTAPRRQPTPTPAETGSVRLSPPAYGRVIDSLMELDYADLALAKESTGKFVAGVLEELAKDAGEGRKAESVDGKVSPSEEKGAGGILEGEEVGGEAKGVVPGAFGVKVVGTMQVDRSTEPAGPTNGAGNGTRKDENGATVLDAGFVRKKQKKRAAEESSLAEDGKGLGSDDVNVLSAGLVRKKAKV